MDSDYSLISFLPKARKIFVYQRSPLRQELSLNFDEDPFEHAAVELKDVGGCTITTTPPASENTPNVRRKVRKWFRELIRIRHTFINSMKQYNEEDMYQQIWIVNKLSLMHEIQIEIIRSSDLVQSKNNVHLTSLLNNFQINFINITIFQGQRKLKASLLNELIQRIQSVEDLLNHIFSHPSQNLV